MTNPSLLNQIQNNGNQALNQQDAPAPPPQPRILPALQSLVMQNQNGDEYIIIQGYNNSSLNFYIVPPASDDLYGDSVLTAQPHPVFIVTWVGTPQNDVGLGSRLLYCAADLAERRGCRWMMILASVKNNFYYQCGFQNGQSGVGDINLIGTTLAVRRACAAIRNRKQYQPTIKVRSTPGQYQ